MFRNHEGWCCRCCDSYICLALLKTGTKLHSLSRFNSCRIHPSPSSLIHFCVFLSQIPTVINIYFDMGTQCLAEPQNLLVKCICDSGQVFCALLSKKCTTGPYYFKACLPNHLVTGHLENEKREGMGSCNLSTSSKCLKYSSKSIPYVSDQVLSSKSFTGLHRHSSTQRSG